MPVVDISLLEGRSDELKDTLIAEVTTAVSSALSISPDQVTVILREMDRRHYAEGGTSISAKEQD